MIHWTKPATQALGLAPRPFDGIDCGRSVEVGGGP